MNDKEQVLEDFIHIIRLIEDDKLKCCDELYDRLSKLYDEIEAEPEFYDEGPEYEQKYDI